MFYREKIIDKVYMFVENSKYIVQQMIHFFILHFNSVTVLLI